MQQIETYLTGLDSSRRCSVCMLSNSSCQSWQNIGVQDFLQLLADAPLYWHHSRFKCCLGNMPCWTGVITDVQGAEVIKWLKYLSGSLEPQTMLCSIGPASQLATQELVKESSNGNTARVGRQKLYHMIKGIGPEQLQQLCMSLPHGHHIIQPFTQPLKELVFVSAVLLEVEHVVDQDVLQAVVISMPAAGRAV